MASIGETKKLVAGVAKQMGQLGGRLDKAKGNFENAKKHADKVLAGSATSIEAEVSGKMQKAAQAAAKAKTAVEKAVAACDTYASSTL